MERTHTYVSRLTAYKLLDTLTHLTCCLIRKRQGKDRAWLYTLTQHIGDTRGQHTCLTRTSTRDNQRGAVVVHNSLTLRTI